jgi:hypothetical protein
MGQVLTDAPARQRQCVEQYSIVGIEFDDLQRDEVTRLCGEVKDLIGRLLGEAPSTLRIVIWPEASKAQNNIAAVSAPFDELRRQHGLGLDPPLELFVQSLDCIRCPDRFPLAFREAREGEQLVAGMSRS